MSGPGHFIIDPRLASVLGESYRRSADALKELVDNSWDADATKVTITMPAKVTLDDPTPGPVIIEDDGLGMTEAEVRQCYLRVAQSRSHRNKGGKTARFQRAIKGRKGIGKFAGLVVADGMALTTWSRGIQTTIEVDKSALISATESGGSLADIDLNLRTEPCDPERHGTIVTLRPLTPLHLPPSADDLARVLFWEYGRSPGIIITINGEALGMEAVGGETITKSFDLPGGGTAKVTYQLSDEPLSKNRSGLVLRIEGKVSGRPQFFGLDDEADIPERIRRCVVGEVAIEGVDSSVIAADGNLFDESMIRQTINMLTKAEVGSAMRQRYTRDINLAKARIQKEIKAKIGALPEHRRAFAEQHLVRVLEKFYPHMADRVETLVWVALEAMEQDEYWTVCEALRKATGKDAETLAQALAAFGLADMAFMMTQIQRRTAFLDHLEELAKDPSTVERQMHEAIASNSWIFGSGHEVMISEATLKSIVDRFCDKEYAGTRAKERPDLLLWSNALNQRSLVEFKRPTFTIDRKTEAQAKTYSDELAALGPFKVIMIGGTIDPVMKDIGKDPSVEFTTYLRLIQDARNRIQWLVSALSRNDHRSDP